MKPPISLGILGAGRIGKIHAETLSHRISTANPIAIFDIDKKAAEDLAAICSIDNVYTDHRALIEHPDIEAVVICSPTPTHVPYIIEAAEAGKHIFCEKPISLDLESIDRALATVRKKGVKLQIGFHKRFDPSMKEARKLIESGMYGEPRILQITSRDPAPPSLEYLIGSGGIFLDMTIHDFDMVRYLMGCEVEEVYAIGGVLVDPAIGSEAQDIDTTIITLKFENGAMGTINNCRQSAYGYDQRVEWFGSKGKLYVDNEKTPHIGGQQRGGYSWSKTAVLFPRAIHRGLPGGTRIIYRKSGTRYRAFSNWA